MPELPEVETVVRGLREPLVGRTIGAVWVDRAKVIHRPSLEAFTARIQGQTVQAVHRRAKYIVCQLDHDLLVVHLKMTGRLYVVPDAVENEADRWLRFRVQLDNGHQLRFSDSRRFGRVYLAGDMMEIAPDLGPEPLEDEFTVEQFRERLAGRTRIIKALLLDQSFIAGVGNIYADEALHRAKIHPLRTADSLSETEIARLYAIVRTVLREGIEREGASVNWYRKPDGTTGKAQEHFYVYDREGQPCLTCGHPIEKIRVAQRGTHYCPQCQLKGTSDVK
ncbi:MAG: bifunctional DNA-formamidopyrimidine glycosylase/DNA-(apurinic or apyrimidinic site) lyase [Anaerolineaceae bacterium]|nr:bifunctional DNA-formamidopyrimidine glycosylase/DNA-(apurinic or apyrimidinic site) lyase [Anaerolineaceae bacterium]